MGGWRDLGGRGNKDKNGAEGIRYRESGAERKSAVGRVAHL